jgi:predicted MFS family arabinose efflux permease
MNNDTDIPQTKDETAEPFVSPMPTRVKKISSGRILKNIMIVNFFYRLFTTSFMFLLPLYGKYGKDWSDQYYGLVLSIGGYTAMVIAFFLGMVVDIRLKRTTLIIGVIFTIISAVLFTRKN